MFSTTNGWLIGKLRRGKLSKAVLENRFSFFFFLNETGTFTLSHRVKRVALESFHEWTLREIIIEGYFSPSRCSSSVSKNNFRHNFISLGIDVRMVLLRIVDLPFKNLSVRKIEI